MYQGSRRQRIFTSALAVALALSLGGMIVLTISSIHDRDAARLALADDSKRLKALETKVGALAGDRAVLPVQATNSPAVQPTAVPALPSHAAPTPPPASLIFPRLTHVTDSLGSDWISGPIVAVPVHIKIGSSITFTAFATDELNRQLQFQFWRGQSPTEQLMCGWGSASCTWTASTLSGCGPCPPVVIHVAVRDPNPTHRLTPCFKIESCDDLETLEYDVEPW
jgi:hypothetical protein